MAFHNADHRADERTDASSFDPTEQQSIAGAHTRAESAIHCADGKSDARTEHWANHGPDYFAVAAPHVVSYDESERESD